MRPTHRQLADQFKQEMRAVLTEDELREIDAENHRRGYDGTCASHDLLDANEVMASACYVLGHSHNAASHEDAKLWNTAWGLAKAEGFAS